MTVPYISRETMARSDRVQLEVMTLLGVIGILSIRQLKADCQLTSARTVGYLA